MHLRVIDTYDEPEHRIESHQLCEANISTPKSPNPDPHNAHTHLMSRQPPSSPAIPPPPIMVGNLKGCLLISTVGGIEEGKVARECIENGIDIVTVGRMFQKNLGLVFAVTDELGVEVEMPNQIKIWTGTNSWTVMANMLNFNDIFGNLIHYRQDA